jgi:hypothetical protein
MSSTFESPGCCTGVTATTRRSDVCLWAPKRACQQHGCPEKFDAELTKRWADAISDAADRDGFGTSAGQFIAAHPELRVGNLLGAPAAAQPIR